MKIVKYGINEAAILRMADICLGLSINGIYDKDGYSDVHSAMMIMVKHRTSINKLRKITNNNARELIGNNDKNAKKLLSLIAPIEEHLKSEENKITQEKERIKKEKGRRHLKEKIEEIKPDKEKILQYAKRLTSIIGPDLKNPSAISIILFAESELNTIAENIIIQSEEL